MISGNVKFFPIFLLDFDNFILKLMLSHKSGRVLLFSLTINCLQSKAQTSQDQKKKDEYAQLKTRIESKQYSFNALSATTQRGKTIRLTSDYSLKLNNDSLQVDLPYYGRAYSVQYAGTDLALQFNTTQFSYVADSSKKGGWDISINKPKNSSGVSKINLYVTAGGYCTIRITSNSRDQISFYGAITAYRNR
jgi:hypothetical protein